MNSKRILHISCLIFCLSCSNTKTESSFSSKLDANCIPIIETFFNKIKSNNFKDALNDLLLSNENFNLKDSATIDLKNKFNDINNQSGSFRGESLLKKRSVNDAIAIYSYLVKYDKKFFRFVFVFYDNGADTKIYRFLFDDSVDSEVEESLKLYTP